MSEIFRIEHNESMVDSKWHEPQIWVLSLLSRNISKYRLCKKIKKVKYWWIDLNSNEFTIKRKIGFDICKSPLKGLSDLDLQIDFMNLDRNLKIDPVLFNDVWNLYEKRDSKILWQTHSKYLELWRNSENFESPQFPCILIDLKNTKDVIEIDTIDEFIIQPDYNGYEWSDSERLIDSRGNIYKADYINFGHPIGVVIPSKIERTIKNSELIEILAGNNIEFRIED